MIIQIFLVAILLITFVVTWRRAHQGVIRWIEAALWSVLWIVAAIVILLPQTATTVARLVGVGRGVDLVIYGSVTLLFVLVFKLFLSFDRMERNLTELVRRDALRDLPSEEHHE